METSDRLWKEVLRLSRETSVETIDEVARQCLEMELPWTSRLAGVAGVLHQVVGLPTGVSIYGVVKPGSGLVLAAGAGLAGPMAAAWGAPIAGLAAQEQAAQFAGQARAFHDYLGGWMGVAECIAVPVMRDRRLFAVLEIRSHEEGRLGLAEAELTARLAADIALVWPQPSQNHETWRTSR
ncbi:MAG: GAF domain-containing protein [Thermaerobacter sp.]|nr:GAF domain-containing protein [Thermaerobacter sp.]